MPKLCITDLDLYHKTAAFRVDYNTPLDEIGHITDDWRIRQSLPSLLLALQQKAKIVLMSHLGQPGSPSTFFSLAKCAKRLSELIPHKVLFAADCIGKEREEKIQRLQPGEVLVLENLRFYPEEEDPSINPNFSAQLAKGCDVFINDAFGTLHRDHTSITKLPLHFPHQAAAGLLVKEEVIQLDQLLYLPKKPFHIIIGGSKVSSKIGVLTSLVSHASDIFIGGKMAMAFLAAAHPEYQMACEDQREYALASHFLTVCQKNGICVHLPVDLMTGSLTNPLVQPAHLIFPERMPEGRSGLDTGPLTVQDWSQKLEKAKTVFWNGPLGVFENPAFAAATNSIIQFLAQKLCIKIIGGGDSVAAVRLLKLEDHFTHLSTGGGASLEYLEKKSLPGLNALSTQE